MKRIKSGIGLILVILVFTIFLHEVSADLSIDVAIQSRCGSTFLIGDEISFFITLNTSVYISVHDLTPKGENEIIKNLFQSRGEHKFSYIVAGPEGHHSLIIKARDKYRKIIEERCDFKVVDRKDSDNDGVPDSRDKCTGSACIHVEATECLLNFYGDGVND